MLTTIFESFIILFVVIDPIGLAPMFAALTYGDSEAYKRRMALKGTALAALVLFVFMLAGSGLLKALGISLPAFRIAGGILLFLLAIDMVFARHSGLRSTTASEQQEAEQKKDIAVFPLAIPLIAGPGAITTLLLMTGPGQDSIARLALVSAVLLGVLLLTLMSLLFAGRLMAWLGETGANVVTRVLGIVLAALAMQFVLDGMNHAFFARA